MYRKLLSKKFFRDNPYTEGTAQQVAYTLLLSEEVEETARDIILEEGHLTKKRLEQIAQEEAMIQAEEDPEKIFNLLRKNLDSVNCLVLINKALDYEEEILPKVAEKLIRSDHDTFIENAVRLLARSKTDYTALLRERFDEIRSPYVKSLVCLVLGFRGGEDTIPWMMDRYWELQEKYPMEDYDQGPLLALYELNARFYFS